MGKNGVYYLSKKAEHIRSHLTARAARVNTKTGYHSVLMCIVRRGQDSVCACYFL